mmetsp:Transcript_121446/g.211079  ORF Transcript_121446/g.211079 Transcript_121446/m.211079 type:complete len:137 (+) Transcript_121446:657-1067(+)
MSPESMSCFIRSAMYLSLSGPSGCGQSAIWFMIINYFASGSSSCPSAATGTSSTTSGDTCGLFCGNSGSTSTPASAFGSLTCLVDVPFVAPNTRPRTSSMTFRRIQLLNPIQRKDHQAFTFEGEHHGLSDQTGEVD